MLKHIARALVSKWASDLNPPSRAQQRYKVCILKADRLGDAVLALGALRLLVSKFGEEECFIIASKWSELLFRHEFPLATIVVMPSHVTHKDLLRTGRQLRLQFGNVMCDQFICLRHQRTDWDEILLSWVKAGAVYVLDPDKASCLEIGSLRRTIFAKVNFRVSEGADRARPWEFNRELWRHAKLLELVLGRALDFRSTRPVLSGTTTGIRGKYILVCPFGSSLIRDFPAELLACVLCQVERYKHLPIQLQSDISRRADLMALEKVLSDQYSLEVECGTVSSVEDYIDEIAGAELVVTVDTAAAHLAVAFDRRAIILHGDAQPNEFVPWGEQKRQRWVSNSMPCRGCNWICVHDRPYCITSVDPAMLAEAVSAVFREE